MFPKAEPTPELLPAVATAPKKVDKKVDNSQLTKTRAGRIRQSRKRTSPSRSRSLFKRVRAAFEAEGPASCLTTKPDIANVNPDIDNDNDAVNVTDPKKDDTPLTTPHPANHAYAEALAS
ncbi:hypothetical protein B0T09DRAFT_402638 [Sordaria sp. MPI-SDFR-AT-0083]|nr:hypothetical protein B0T09DRAFT_402638 [Sordaria sp. MPI-SDFR-AT-0083]